MMMKNTSGASPLVLYISASIESAVSVGHYWIFCKFNERNAMTWIVSCDYWALSGSYDAVLLVARVHS